MKKSDVIVIVAGLIVLAGLAVSFYFIPQAFPGIDLEDRGLVVLTDKTEYSTGEPLKVQIRNNKEDRVCFSSCYPYHLQVKNGAWKYYDYEDCNKEDVVESCIDPNSEKAFELTLPKLASGLHRLAISACLGCRLSEHFKKNESIFSNKFIVK